MYLFPPKNKNTGLGDKLTHIHNSIFHSTPDNIIVDNLNDPVSLFLKSQSIQKRIFVHTDEDYEPNIPWGVDKDLQLFEAGKKDYDVYVQWPELYDYNFFEHVMNMNDSKDKDRLIKHLLKRSFKKDWEKPNLDGIVINYNETDIVDVFNTIKNSRCVYGPEGGIYHLCVYFNKPFVMIVPDKIWNENKNTQKTIFQHTIDKHPTYQHHYISESVWNKFAYL